MERNERKPLRVAVYCRLARADGENIVLDAQREKLRVYAKEQGYAIVAEITEIGSGLSLNRPGIRELCGLAHRRAMDAVLTVNLSRLGRNTGDVLHLAGKLKKQHVAIHTPQGNPLPAYRQMVTAIGHIKG